MQESVALPLRTKSKSRIGKFCLDGSSSAKRESHNSEPVQELRASAKKDAGVSRPVKYSVIPSVSLSQMLRLGKLIVPDVDVVTLRLEGFSIEKMQ